MWVYPIAVTIPIPYTFHKLCICQYCCSTVLASPYYVGMKIFKQCCSITALRCGGTAPGTSYMVICVVW